MSRTSFSPSDCRRVLCNPRFSVQYKTGYAPVARHNTVRAEVGLQVLELPVTFWMQDGYNSSLARYYKKDHGTASN